MKSFKTSPHQRIAALIAIMIFVAAGYSAITIHRAGAFNTLASFASSAKAAAQPQDEQSFVIGTCDTAGPIEVESTGGTAAGVPTLYTTINAAFTAINAGLLHQGTINIEVCGNTTEPATPTPLLRSNAPSNYTSISIKPVGGNRTINSNAAPTASRGMIEFNGADNVTIDGDDPGTAGTRNLTFQMAAVTTTGLAVIRYASSAATDGATNNIIKNSIVIGSRSAATSTVTTFGIYSGTAGTANTSASGQSDNNDNLTIENNEIKRAYYGIYAAGTATNYMDNLVIKNNIIGSATAADSIAHRGVLFQNTQAIASPDPSKVAIIEGNDIRTRGVNAASSDTGATMGIEIVNGNAGALVRKNMIHDVTHANTSGYGAYGITVTGSGNNSGVTIFNNFIWDITNFNWSASISATSTDIPNGIRVSAGAANLKIYHNTVRLNAPNGTPTTAGFSACLQITTTGVTGSDIRDNIFANTQTGLAGSKYYAVVVPSGFTFGTSNYNDYFALTAINIIGWNGSDRTTLAAWQGVTTQDANSKAVDPGFVSATDLHITSSSPLESQGVSITSVTDDIDGDSRPNPPDIGADEVMAVVAPGQLQFSSATYAGNEGTTATITVTRTSGSAGSVTIDYATSNGTATGGAMCGAGVDYVNTSGTLTFINGDTSETFTVQLCSDDVLDTGETINLALTNPGGGATLGTPNTAVLTITDTTPSLQFSAATYSGNENTTATITVTRTGSTTGTSTVDYATGGGTATGGGACGAGVDYVSVSGTLTFNPTVTSQTFTVQLCSDAVAESSETVGLALSNTTGGALGSQNTATLNILDVASQFCNTGTITIPPTNTTPPYASTPYPSAIAVSGLTGTVSTVRVTLYNLSHTFPDDIDILLVGPGGQKFVLMSDAGGSIASVNQTLTFSDGATALADGALNATGLYKPTNYEAANDVFATGAPAGPYSDPGPGGTPAGTATLNGTFGGTNPNGNWQLYVSDDASQDGGSITGWCLEITTLLAPGSLQFSSATYNVAESGGTATITVTRTGGSSGTVTADYATSDGTATGGAMCGGSVDYVNTSGTVSFADGDTSETFTIPICFDGSAEGTETVNLALTNPTGGATLGTPNTAVLSITNSTVFNGSYNVGTGEAYTSLTNTGGLFEAINNGALSASTTINITSNLTGETGTVALNQWVEQGAGTYTLTIQPSGGERSISGSGASGLIRLNGADRVVIDGDDTSVMGIDRSLTINNTGAGAIVWLASTSGGNGATGNTVKNCKLVGGGPTTTSDGILSSGSTGGVAEAANSGNKFQNNSVTAVIYGISLIGPSGNESGNEVTGNDLGSTITASKLTLAGIDIFQQQNALIAGNSILGVTTSTTNTSSGIFVGGTQSGVTITGNRIRDIKNTNTTGYGANGIQLSSSSTAANVTVSNNFVWDVTGDGFTGGAGVEDNGYGIIATSGGGYNIYHNSVNLNTNQPTAGITAAINITSGVTTANAIDMRNNIFANPQTTGTRYGIYSGAAATVYSQIDYNDYYAPGGSVGFLTSARATIANWRTATGKDVNSMSAPPLYVSATDLHIQAATGTNPISPVSNAGTTITSVTVDFDNESRTATPDIGADEFTNNGGTLAAGSYSNLVLDPGTTSLGGNTTVTGTLTLNGMVDTGGNLLTIGCAGNISGASSSNYVIGNLEKSYCGTGTFTYPTGTADGYMPLDVDVTTLTTNPSSLTVKANDGLAPSSPALNSAKSLQAFWSLAEEGDLTVNLVFHYLQSDVPMTANELNFRLVKIEGGGTPSTFPPSQAPVDTTANTASINGVTSFSDWTMAEPDAPTSVEANVGGRVLTDTGQPLAGVEISLLDTQLGQTRTSMTDANGGFHFSSVPTGRDILVTPAREGYSFTPQNQVFSHTGERLNVNFMATPDTTPANRAVSDFDGDGRTDLSVFRPSDATWYILPSSTNVMRAMQWGINTDRIVPADYDGDGRTDVAVWRPSTGAWHIYQSATETVRSVQWGISEDVVAPADYDGDGKADPAVFRASTGSWYILQSTDGQMRAYNWGTAGDRPVAADYDNDGRADIAVYRPSTGTWYIVNSSNGEQRAVNWGLATDLPLTGDFDGDGRADLAVFRPETGYWYVLQSADGSISARAHGTGADRPVAGDYDGDGKTDRAVWQQADGNWNIMRSTTNAPYGQLWGTSGDVPAPSAYVP